MIIIWILTHLHTLFQISLILHYNNIIYLHLLLLLIILKYGFSYQFFYKRFHEIHSFIKHFFVILVIPDIYLFWCLYSTVYKFLFLLLEFLISFYYAFKLNASIHFLSIFKVPFAAHIPLLRKHFRPVF